MKSTRYLFQITLVTALLLGACSPQNNSTKTPTSTLHALAVETFLADIAQNVAGDRIQVDALIPVGVDPHTFEPTPQDVARIAQTDVLIVNGHGFEAWLDGTLKNAGGKALLVEASAGLTPRTLQAGENAAEAAADHPQGDPHFWLDPQLTIRYVENIRDGLIQVDPAGKVDYERNAAAYIGQIKDLDIWIGSQMNLIPADRRLMVTNHESFGYFADRYGLRIVGSIVQSFSSGAAPSAQQMAGLIEQVRASGAPAVFLETGANPQLAEQLAQETGIQVVTDLYTHSTTAADGVAPTYLTLMRHNVNQIVAALR